MIFKIKIADRIVEIVSIYDRIFKMCKDYLVVEDACDFQVVIEEKDILYEEKKALEDQPNAHYSHAYLETLAVYRKIAVEMLAYDTILMHGAVWGIKDKSYMITAPSGVGKTTILNSILEIIDGSYVINGDKPLLMWKYDGKPKLFACGTPWAGKESMQQNCLVALEGIFLLDRQHCDEVHEHTTEDSVDRIPFNLAFPQLLQQVYRPSDANSMIKAMDLLGRIKGSVPIYRLRISYYQDKKYLKNSLMDLIESLC